MATNALYTGVAGLQAHATMLDVVGNNLANSNTTAYKAQRVLFEDLVYRTLSPGTAAGANGGGTNPQQVGFGVRAGAIDALFKQGPLTPTGRDLDLALEGGGFFVVRDGTRQLFTRAGAFSIDTAGYLVDSATGYRVQRFGTVGEATATTPAFQAASDFGIRIPQGASIPSSPTANVTVGGNLSATLAVGAASSIVTHVYDTQGAEHALSVTFTKTAANTFSVSATVTGGTVTVPATPVTFTATGALSGPATLALTLNGLPSAQTVTLNLGGAAGLTQFGGATTAAALSQDGFGAGTLSGVGVNAVGVLQGTFTNGQTLALAQLALADFSNPNGLLRAGDNFFSAGTASGVARIGGAGTGSIGAVRGGVLEGSNVELALELSRLIIAQRGFQVNARTITASNELEQELTNIIR